MSEVDEMTELSQGGGIETPGARPASHRVGDELLAGYVAGALPEAFGLVIAAQASLDPETRARLADLEAIGGALLEEGPAVEMREDALAATLARIAAAGDDAPEADVAPSPDSPDCEVLPAPVRAYVGGGLADVRWRPVGMGAKQAILHETGEASVRLLSIPAGCEMPDHGHHGTEMTLVLKGAFLDGGARYARGDVEVVDEDVAHHPVADIGEECICLVACEGRLKFSGLLPRMAQPFLRI
jgi:putative transcriptional regulator